MKKIILLFFMLLWGSLAHADSNVDNLTSKTTPASADETYIVDIAGGTVDKKTTISGIFNSANITANNSNVGIGSTNPGTALDVNGTTRTIGATITGNATVAGTLGVTGHVTLESTTSTGATGTGQLVFGTAPLLNPNVGIGTTFASNTLYVQGGVTAQSFTSYGTGPGYTKGNFGIGTANPAINGLEVASNVTIGTTYATYQTAPTNGLAVQGNVGIGTWLPALNLDVNGTVRMTGFVLTTGKNNGYVLTSDANGNGTWNAATGGLWNTVNTNDVYEANGATYGNVGIGTTSTADASFKILKNSTTDYVHINSTVSGGGNVFTIVNGGNVGIGTVGPTALLQVSGSGNDSITGGNLGIGTAAPNSNVLEVEGGSVGIGTVFGNSSQAIGIGTEAQAVGETLCLGTGHCVGWCSGTITTSGGACSACSCLTHR